MRIRRTVGELRVHTPTKATETHHPVGAMECEITLSPDELEAAHKEWVRKNKLKNREEENKQLKKLIGKLYVTSRFDGLLGRYLILANSIPEAEEKAKEASGVEKVLVFPVFGTRTEGVYRL